MSQPVDHTTLLCLFHTSDEAEAALDDLRAVSVPQDLISVLGVGRDSEADRQTLVRLGTPAQDLDHLEQELAAGGIVITVRALTEHVADVERVFEKHRAEKIDEAEVMPEAGSDPVFLSEPTILPVVNAAAAKTGAGVRVVQDIYVGEDESDALAPEEAGFVTEPAETVLLVSQSEVASGEADRALEVLEEESLSPVEVVVVADTPREPVRPMEPYIRYGQVD